ncbi:hypothetical protein T552_04063 [Pneumocystis carinii B80]|uniref:Uncharacterized protein n=1 Tax=Pneumocystis carinii (strain B80) TaxID=1408658 RepID=A0A0W4ZTI2_PNEC8|nr:hypothetical protein T552_04063 [Pneumocystis carinii B80]KTW31652.1 hypothetical protein T552_04063 [Pneumocystis carinii B80]
MKSTFFINIRKNREENVTCQTSLVEYSLIKTKDQKNKVKNKEDTGFKNNNIDKEKYRKKQEKSFKFIIRICNVFPIF